MDRLPSPPPDSTYDHVGDVIGSTVYSQRFVLKTLMDILKSADNSNGASHDSMSELEPKLEERLCILWDMSTENEVSGFLCDQNCLEIFENVIRSTNKPRLTVNEILVGIIGNMICNESLKEKFKNDETFCDLVLNMCSCRDSQTLVETMRTLQSCTEFDFWTSEWEEKFVLLDIWDDLLFIAKSTTNETLLKYVCQIIESVLEKSKCAKNFLDKENSVVSLIEILDNCLSENNDECCSYLLRGLQNLSTDESVSTKFLTHWNDIFSFLIKVLANISSKLNKKEFDFTLNSTILTCLACSFSLLNWNFDAISNDVQFREVFKQISIVFDDKKINAELKNDHYYKIVQRQYFEINEKLIT